MRAVLPIPLSVLLTLLWTGLVHLMFLWVRSQTAGPAGGAGWADAFWSRRLPGGVRLPTVLVGICLLLLIYLWADYRSRRHRGGLGWVFLGAAALLVYLAWAIWRLWWQHLQSPLGIDRWLLTALAVPGG